MALFRLEDLLAPRADTNQVLDLSASRPRTRQEFEKLLANVPEFRIKPEKIRSEEVYISEDFNFSWKKQVPSKNHQSLLFRTKEFSTASAGAYHSNKLQQQQHISRITPGVYPVIVNCRSGYPNPIPVAMQSVRILDLAQVDINWKMLTVARPSTKLDDEYFTKLVNLEKLRLQTRRQAGPRTRRTFGFLGGITVRRIIRTNRSGVTEIRLPACLQCGVELCDSTNCVKFSYEDFLRQSMEATDEDKKDPNEPVDEDEEKRVEAQSKKDVISSMKEQALKMRQAKKKQFKSKRLTSTN